MDLFSTGLDENQNLLPKDGIFIMGIYALKDANFIWKIYWNYSLKNDEAVILVNSLLKERSPGMGYYFSYTYSKRTKQALIWTWIAGSKTLVEEKLEKPTILVCFISHRYRRNGLAQWCRENLKKNGAIASVSFGAERKFTFKHRDSKETVSQNLSHGSLLVMKDETQTHWQHRLPPTTRYYS
jgi:alkylated DNA repair dioxygenase AlkB